MTQTDGRPDDILYQKIIDGYLETESIQRTAKALRVSEVKVRRVLITEKMWSSRTSLAVQHYHEQGLPAARIASALNTTEKAVQQYLPYTRGIYNKEQRSADAVNSEEYRRRIRIVREKTLKKSISIAKEEGWEEMSGMSGTEEIEMEGPETDGTAMEGKEKKSQSPVGVMRLHLELISHDQLEQSGQFQHSEQFEHSEQLELNEQNGNDEGNKMKESAAMKQYRLLKEEEEQRVLHSYGRVKYGDRITRDIAVPEDMPLYALHYMIQRAFGWENSHLHSFRLPETVFSRLTENSVLNWLELVGVLFRSPLMGEEDRFWADDYEKGSFRNWLKRKYTGPYLSLNHGEGIVQCRRDVYKIMKEFPEVRTASLTDIFTYYERDPKQLLERLSIGDLLAVRDVEDTDNTGKTDASAFAGKAEKNRTEISDTYGKFMTRERKADIESILESGVDEPNVQPQISCCTDTLLYEYDYGDGWLVRITAPGNCADLVRQGRITEQELARVFLTVEETYRPVCLAADGLPVLDDVGGMDGYIRFLRGINKEKEKVFWNEKGVAEGWSREEYLDAIPDNWDYDQEGTLEWARSLGWTGRMSRPEKLL